MPHKDQHRKNALRPFYHSYSYEFVVYLVPYTQHTYSSDSLATKLTYLHDTCIHINFNEWTWAQRIFQLCTVVCWHIWCVLCHGSDGGDGGSTGGGGDDCSAYRCDGARFKTHSNPNWKFNLHWSNNTDSNCAQNIYFNGKLFMNLCFA